MPPRSRETEPDAPNLPERGDQGRGFSLRSSACRCLHDAVVEPLCLGNQPRLIDCCRVFRTLEDAHSAAKVHASPISMAADAALRRHTALRMPPDVSVSTE